MSAEPSLALPRRSLVAPWPSEPFLGLGLPSAALRGAAGSVEPYLGRDCQVGIADGHRSKLVQALSLFRILLELRLDAHGLQTLFAGRFGRSSICCWREATTVACLRLNELQRMYSMSSQNQTTDWIICSRTAEESVMSSKSGCFGASAGISRRSVPTSMRVPGASQCTHSDGHFSWSFLDAWPFP